MIPTTYLLNDPASREAFSAEMAGADDGRPWILKRTDLSNGESTRIITNPATWVQSEEFSREFDCMIMVNRFRHYSIGIISL
eukprot:COSAG05_NODE_1949_length_3794_cov_5.044182_5_plen_82_part_00